MGKVDDKGEPVKTVTIGGKEVEVPIIFILPEEAGEKEIKRYEHPEVNIKKEGKAAESEEEPLEELTDGKLEEVEKPKEEAPKKKKEPLLSNSWEALRQEWEDILPDESKKGFGKAQALARWYEQNKPKKEKEYLTDEEGDEIEKGVINNQPQIPDQTDKILAELKRKKKPKEKAWEKWLENKSLGALGWGKLNRDGTKQKLRKRQPKLDDFTDDDGDKKDET